MTQDNRKIVSFADYLNIHKTKNIIIDRIEAEKFCVKEPEWF